MTKPSSYINRLASTIFLVTLGVHIFILGFVLFKEHYSVAFFVGFAILFNLVFFANRARFHLISLVKTGTHWKLEYYDFNTKKEKLITNDSIQISFRLASGRDRRYKFEVKDGKKLALCQYEKVGDWTKEKLEFLFEELKKEFPEGQKGNVLVGR